MSNITVRYKEPTATGEAIKTDTWKNVENYDFSVKLCYVRIKIENKTITKFYNSKHILTVEMVKDAYI